MADSTIQDPRYVVGDVPISIPQTDCVGLPPIPLRNTEAELRRACAEMLLAGSMLLSDVSREAGGWNSSSQAKQSEERFRKALECGREALS